METSLPDLLQVVKDGAVLTPEVFGQIDYDEILTERDGDKGFEGSWNRCYNAVEKKWGDSDVSDEIEQMVEEIREQSYEISAMAMEQHELANVISDDFDLFARSIVMEFNDEFLESLWEAYENGEVPSPSTLNEREE